MTQGFIYGYADLRTPNEIKVGRTSNVENRLSVYRTTSHRHADMFYVAEVYDMFSMENAFKSAFARHRLYGEWYGIDREHFLGIVDFLQMAMPDQFVNREIGSA